MSRCRTERNPPALTCRLKVEGSGREWHVWEYVTRGGLSCGGLSCWNIVAGPFLTKRRADAEKQKMEKQG